jgi:hypothetical protein
MARELELRSRVERLLKGDIRPNDLLRLFLWLRFNFGASSIREIGHFIGHSDERDTGLVTDEAKDFFLLLHLRLPDFRPIDLDNVPGYFPDLLRRNFRRISTATIKNGTGMKRKVANATLDSALSKFHVKQDGRYYLRDFLSRDESDLLVISVEVLVSRPAFTDESLFDDFVFVLGKNKLLHDDERKLLKALKAPLAVFAIATMHHVRLLLVDDWRAELHGGINRSNPERPILEVTAAAPLPGHVGGKPTKLAYPMFSTNINPSDWCSPKLIETPTSKWNFSIEMSDELKLVPL